MLLWFCQPIISKRDEYSFLSETWISERKIYSSRFDRLTECPWQLNGRNSVHLRLSKWNQNWSVRNSYSYTATATTIRFHFQSPRSPDAAFGGLIGWLFNWKYNFSCRTISNMPNYLKYNDFLNGDGIDKVTLWLRKFSGVCSRYTVGVAGDDIISTL